MQFLIIFMILCIMSYIAIKFILDKFTSKTNIKMTAIQNNMHTKYNIKMHNNKIDQKKITSDDINKFEIGIKNLILQHRSVMTTLEQYVDMYGKNQTIMLFKISYKQNITSDEFLNNVFKNEKKFINKSHT